MPMKPKLSSKTPDAADYNSLIETHADLVSLPRERRYAIVELRVKKVDLDVASGEQQAIVELVHVETPSTQADETKLVDLLDTMFTKRTKIKQRGNPLGEEDTPLAGIGLDDDEVGA